MTSVRSGQSPREVFESAWADPRNTAIDLPPVDVNQVLNHRYDLGQPLLYTREMLWDMEIRKAGAPDVYIPSVVKPGSVEKWDAGVPDQFTRVSEQRLWLNPDEFGLIIEHVQLDHDKQSVYFIGAAHHVTPDGRHLVGSTAQPLFHVEHWVDGTKNRPVNRWKILHLTEQPDQAMLDFFTGMGQNPYLRDFIEVHIREVLGRRLVRR
jgi:hypothetical protein